MDYKATSGFSKSQVPSPKFQVPRPKTIGFLAKYTPPAFPAIGPLNRPFSNAASAQSTPLLPRCAPAASLPVVDSYPPDRATACSSELQVKMPNSTGVWQSTASWDKALLTALLIYWSCVVSPRMTAPKQITAAYCSDSASVPAIRRDLERAGHPSHVDILLRHAALGQRFHRPVQKPRGYRLVEPRNDDRKAAFRGRWISSVNVHD